MKLINYYIWKKNRRTTMRKVQREYTTYNTLIYKLSGKPLHPQRLKTTRKFKRYYPGDKIPPIFKGTNPVDMVYGTAFKKFNELAKYDNGGTLSKFALAWQCGGFAFVSLVSVAFWGASIIVNNNQLNNYMGANNTKWTITKNILNMGLVAMQGTPKSFGALLMSVGTFGYSVYELIKVCDTPIIRKPVGILMMPFTWAANKFKSKALTYVQLKVEQAIMKTHYTWVIPIIRYITTGQFRITAKGISTVEGLHIIKEFDNGLILKANNHYYTISHETWEKILESTKDLPSDYLNQNINNILIKAGQEIPENMTVLLNKLLTENISPEKITDTLAEHNINFFSKEIPTEFINYKAPYGSWEQVESYINLLKDNIPEQFQEFSAVKFMFSTVVIIGVSIFAIFFIKGIYNETHYYLHGGWNKIKSFSNYIWTSSKNFWYWWSGKSPYQQIEYNPLNDIVNKDTGLTNTQENLQHSLGIPVKNLNKYKTTLDEKVNTMSTEEKAQYFKYKTDILKKEFVYDSYDSYINNDPQIKINPEGNKETINYKISNKQEGIFEDTKDMSHNEKVTEYLKKENQIDDINFDNYIQDKSNKAYTNETFNLYPKLKNTINNTYTNIKNMGNNIFNKIDNSIDNFINPTLKKPSAPDLSQSYCQDDFKINKNIPNFTSSEQFDTYKSNEKLVMKNKTFIESIDSIDDDSNSIIIKEDIIDNSLNIDIDLDNKDFN